MILHDSDVFFVNADDFHPRNVFRIVELRAMLEHRVLLLLCDDYSKFLLKFYGCG